MGLALPLSHDGLLSIRTWWFVDWRPSITLHDGTVEPLRVSPPEAVAYHWELLKHRVPIRTFADWEETGPGFMEADLVAHCGVHADGPFLHTLVLTDVGTGWTECLALLHRSEAAAHQSTGRGPACHASLRQLRPSGKAPTEGDLLQAELQLPVLEQRKKRRYRRTNKPRVPHTWRTRPDPFDGVWKEVQSWLKSEPERTAKSLFLQFQQRDLARYSNGQLRTMQHRVREWRRQILVSFNAKWLELDRFGLTQASPKAAGDNGCGKDGRFATVENPFQLIDRSVTFLMRQREK